MINNIAFSGGGMKGLAYIGVVKFLEEKDAIKDINIFSGTSIGSLTALMLNLGYNYKEMYDLATNIDLYKLEDIDIENFFQRFGLNKGEKITQFLKYLITHKGYNENITFKQLHDITKKTLHITSCLLNDYSCKIFNHINTPDFEIYKACKYSMRIPLLWSIEDQEHYIDGCFSANLPIEILDVKNTIGITTITRKVYTSSDNLKEYIFKLVKCMMFKNNSIEIEKYRLKGYRIIIIDIGDFSSTDLNSDFSKRKHIIQSGYDACLADNFLLPM